jgi:hypothetical protein
MDDSINHPRQIAGQIIDIFYGQARGTYLTFLGLGCEGLTGATSLTKENRGRHRQIRTDDQHKSNGSEGDDSAKHISRESL